MTLFRVTLTATLLLVLIGRGWAQNRGSAPTREQMMIATLQAIAQDDWRAGEPIMQWNLLEAFNAELERNPESSLAALVRQAVTRVDIRVTPIIARTANEVSITTLPESRLDLTPPIPYLADVYASVDGGEWFLLSRVHDHKICGPSGQPPQVARLEPGLHRVQAVVDISYLREAAEETDGDLCANPPGYVIQRERRELFARSFGIFPVLPTNVPASSIEPGLPDVPLSAWLRDEGARIGMDREGYWRTDFCNLQEAAVFAHVNWKRAPGPARAQARPICLTYRALRPDMSSVVLRLRVARVKEDTDEWAFEQPAFHDLSIGGDGNVLDVPYLSLLPQVVNEPAAGFPELDVSIAESDVRYEPANAKPGDPITVKVVIRNIGQRDAPMTTGLVILDSAGYNQRWREFVADIPAGGAYEVSFPATMPAAGAIAASVSDTPSLFPDRRQSEPYSQLRDINWDNNHAVRMIGSR